MEFEQLAESVTEQLAGADTDELAGAVTDQLSALAASLRAQGSRVGIGELLTAHLALCDTPLVGGPQGSPVPLLEQALAGAAETVQQRGLVDEVASEALLQEAVDQFLEVSDTVGMVVAAGGCPNWPRLRRERKSRDWSSAP